MRLRLQGTLPGPRRLALVVGSLAAVSLTAPQGVPAFAASGSARTSHSTDSALCPFTLEITATSSGPAASALGLEFLGPSTITLRNGSTGRTAVLHASGTYSVDRATGAVRFRGHRLWFRSTGKNIPFLSTDGPGSLVGPNYVLKAGNLHRQTIDPCALVGPVKPSTAPPNKPAPWGLPADALGRFEQAGLTPVIGGLTRHDHVHLDVIVNGHRITVPAGVGAAEPADAGPCAPGFVIGDCRSGHFFTANVAYSPVHTHSTSGIIHIESDRPGRFTLGAFFDEWGVRLDSRCIASYCQGRGKALRVFVNGKQVPGNPRSIVLTNRQEIAIFFGGLVGAGSVPRTFKGGWPGPGCGGAGERSCLPIKTG